MGKAVFMPPGRHPETLKNLDLELSFCPLPLPVHSDPTAGPHRSPKRESS